MEKTDPSVWEDESYVQVRGPRYSVFVVPAQDVAVFTLGRLPERERARRRAHDLEARLRALLEGRSMRLGVAAAAVGRHHNELRYAATTGAVVIRWDGAVQPTLWMTEPPDVEPSDARKELARRYHHIYGPSAPEGFASWAGVSVDSANRRLDDLDRSLTPMKTPIGAVWC
jgi:hypothetical protein